MGVGTNVAATKFPFITESLQGTLGEYGLVTPISTDSEGRFLSHAVSAAHGRRRSRRDTEGFSHEPRSDRLFFNVTVFGKEFHLRLRLNSRLVAPGAKIEWQEDTNVTSTEPLLGDCFYVGDITDVQGASVAISNCDGLLIGGKSLSGVKCNILGYRHCSCLCCPVSNICDIEKIGIK
ncbi:UNVERIFIED_CONTAM: hypothetical protein FKN15_051496 [Acipenser sinensis]